MNEDSPGDRSPTRVGTSDQLGFLLAYLRDPARQPPLGDSVLMMAAAEIERLSADAARLDFLQHWVESSKARGFKWDTFTFNCSETGKTVREQLDEQILAGLRELPKC